MKKILFWGVVLPIFLLFSPLPVKAASLEPTFSSDDQKRTVMEGELPSGEGNCAVFYADGAWHCVYSKNPLVFISNGNGSTALRFCDENKTLLDGFELKIWKLYGTSPSDWGFYDSKAWYVFNSDNFAVARSNQDLYMGADVDGKFVPEEAPFFQLPGPVLPPIARVQEWKKVLEPLIQILPIMMAFLVSLVAFWKAWSFLKSALRGA